MQVLIGGAKTRERWAPKTSHVGFFSPLQTPAPPPPPPPPPPTDAGSTVADVCLLITLLRELTETPPQPACGVAAPAPAAQYALAAPVVHHQPLTTLPPGAWAANAYQLPPPRHPPTSVTRSLTSATYLRRLFVTRDLSHVLGVVAPPRAPTVRRQAAPGEILRPLRVDADPLPDVPLVVLDHRDRVWHITFSPRRYSPATGRLTTGWSKLCAALRAHVGDAVLFARLPGVDVAAAAAAGQPTARVSLLRGGGVVDDTGIM